MAKQPHHIPMLFMMDVIHGMKTISRRRWRRGPPLIRTPANAHPQLQKKHPQPDFTLPFPDGWILCAMQDGAVSWNPQAKIHT